ncbi:uroporphyrinogen-III synthase [Methylocaldum sp.]|uniref:uroporphyrinogen-III synthase n=1 Tax=Methylocaldum sp. TaxID=1969727 RepID=UPI002D6CBAAE|nr:uroporphyrinogen-III synthase [Methylocaldum sp.]HYE35274.1 uroporphyrinogen-III synthase [Methylocaldum sp.]
MANPTNAPLAGVGVLVTRPREQADGLCALIEAAGGRAMRLPLLEIVAVDDSTAAAELLSRPDQWDWLIFASTNAVRFALAIHGRPYDPPRRTRIAAIGQATAEELIKAGIRVDLIPKPQFNSESLLASPEMADVTDKSILIVRGEGGREHLAEVLRSRGAKVAYAEVYRRILPETDTAHWIDLWRQGRIDVVTITSGEALTNLTQLLGDAKLEFAERTPLVVIGSRVEKLAREQGWRYVVSTEQAGDQALAETIIRLIETKRSVRNQQANQQ